MKSDKSPLSSGMAPRQKAIIAGVGLIVLVILWQLYSVYESTKPMPGTATSPSASQAGGASPAPGMQSTGTPPIHTPQPSTLATDVNTEREAALLKIQKETESTYISKMSELQLLRLSQQFAETNQAIMKAKLETVTAQKKIVDLLQTDTERANASGQNASAAMEAAMRNMQAQQQLAQQQTIASYMVVSVTNLQGQWRAVLGAQGRLFNVKVGDVLPLDGAKVMNISSNGVTVERNGNTMRFSMVPMI